jgi:hypothetical protein
VQPTNQQIIMPGCFELLKVGDYSVFNNLCADIVDKQLAVPAIQQCCRTCNQKLPNNTQYVERLLDLREAHLDVITKIVCDQPFCVTSPGGTFGGSCKLVESVKQDHMHVVDFKRGLPLDPRPYNLICARVWLPRNQACGFVVSGAAYDEDSLREIAELASQKVFVELSWTLAVVNDSNWLGVLFCDQNQHRFPPGWPGYDGPSNQETWKNVFAYQSQSEQTQKVDSFFARSFCPASWLGKPVV